MEKGLYEMKLWFVEGRLKKILKHGIVIVCIKLEQCSPDSTKVGSI